MLSRLVIGEYSSLRPWERAVMKGTVRTVKLMFRNVPYAAVLTLLYLVVARQWTATRLLLAAWSACEIGFFGYWKLRMARPFQRKPSALTEEERAAICRRLVANVDDMEDMLARWHEDAGPLPASQYREWMVWMLFDKREEELTVGEEAQLDRLIPLLVNTDGGPRASMPKPRAIRPSIDEMKMQPKPFALFAAIKCVQKLGAVALHALGFRRRVAGGLAYWHCAGPSPEPPILYIHGIGIGFAMYMAKLLAMRVAHRQRSFVLIELPHISMEITDAVLDHDETLRAIDAIFKAHALERVSVVGHSYGTVVASWLMRERPHYLARLTLVDPVCFCMWDSTLARNFLYARPLSFVHELALFFVARDPLIAHAVSKELYWSESVLYPADIAVPTHIFLATQDWVVDAATCNRYLQQRLPPQCTIELMETSHGGCLASRQYISQIAQCV